MKKPFTIISMLTEAVKQLWLSAALIFVLSLFISCQDAPQALLSTAKQSVETAETAEVDRYAPESMKLAKVLFQTAQLEIAKQNGRLAPFRDYAGADSLLRLADVAAYKARRDAADSLGFLRITAFTQVTAVGKDLSEWRKKIQSSLAKLKFRQEWYTADIAYKTGRKLFQAGEYESALASLSKAKYALVKLETKMDNIVDGDNQRLPVWREWVDETIKTSRAESTYAIIVDKSARKTYLIKSGRLVHTYSCDLGYNSGDHKLRSGDGATPEGMYQVTMLKARGSKYYKALPINYPNQADKRHFAENKKEGVVPRLAGIGSAIEIHGEGGQNKDWTEGCVALTNSDMDHIFKYVRVGTPVTIVRRSDMWP
ncbi:MAG: L,D-transpeptidase [candidate division Zixibacteria bacterium]|nr:L,D-transpeptidase [candidate division Zixibacteria bacterium]